MKLQHAAPLALLLSLAVLLPGCAAPEPEPTLLTIRAAQPLRLHRRGRRGKDPAQRPGGQRHRRPAV